MLIHGRRDGLLSACQLVGAAAAGRTTKPILTQIKAVAEGETLSLMATDLEVGIRYSLHAIRVERPGEVILPTDRITKILRESGDLEVTIEADGQKLRVQTSTSEYEMATENPREFPDIPEPEGAAFHSIEAGQLRGLIRKVAFAAGKDNAKFAITGILWEVENGTVRMVATDTKRLALAVAPAEVSPDVEPGQSYLVPTKAMSLLDRTLAEYDDAAKVGIALRQNDALFRLEKATIYTRLVEGRYPPYRDIIPKKHNARAGLIAEPFLSAVRQAAIMTDDDSKRVSFAFTNGRMTLQAQGATTGKSKVEARVEYEGPDLTIHFDPQYLTEMLRILGGEDTLTLDLVDHQRPAVFRQGDAYVYLVMPLS